MRAADTVYNTSVIEAASLGKAYRIWSSPSARLWYPLLQAVSRLLPSFKDAGREGVGLWRGKPAYRDFHALSGVDLQVVRGEAVGIIGRNGSGKSTLLQLIAGTLTASEGKVTTCGRVAALLELGSGFNPEFSGRENVILNATVLGLTREQIDERFEAIVAYSEIGDFIDQPVRTYSSGMMLRLAFAVAAHVDPDILIIDEALGVGDARFQLKCARTIDQFIEKGVTLLFVSHDASSIKRLCRRAVLLEKGRVVHQGTPNEVVNLYSKLIAEGGSLEAIRGDLEALRSQSEKRDLSVAASGEAENTLQTQVGDRDNEAVSKPSFGIKREAAGAEGGAAALQQRIAFLEATLRDRDRLSLAPAKEAALVAHESKAPPGGATEFSYGDGSGAIESIQILDTTEEERPLFVSGEQVRVLMRVSSKERIPEPIFALTLKSSSGVEVYGTNTLFSGQPASPMAAGEACEVEFSFALNLMQGHYFLSFGFTHFVGEELLVVHRRYDALRIEVVVKDRTFGIANLHARIVSRREAGGV